MTMNTTDPVDLEALRDMRFAADNGGATEGQCYSWWKGITAELTARRARDAEVEALVPLAAKHQGMRVSAAGVLGRVQGDLRFGADSLLKGLRELADRFYKGDLRVVDEFLQCFALDDARPAAHDAPDECFCDRMYPDSNPNASCGDCPTRDYGAQPAPAPVQVDGAGELPPLPAAEYRVSPDSRQPSLYDEDAMRAYARAAIAARLAQQPTHSLSHECPEWDGLRITPDMPEWEACGCFVVSGVAQQPAAAVPDMAAFDKAVSDLNSWAIVYGRLSTDANLRALVEAREAVKALHAQALASRVQVPDAKHWRAAIVEITFGEDDFDTEDDALDAIEARARLLASAEQGAK